MNRETACYHKLDVTLPQGDEREKQGGAWMQLYWSQNSGVYGHQVIMEYNVGRGFETYTTGGCGYCKLSACLEKFLSELLNKRISFGGDLSYLASGTKIHKGGNYYKATIPQLKKALKR